MREVPLAVRLMEATVKAVKVPVTVKMRMGWCHASSQMRPNWPVWPRTWA